MHKTFTRCDDANTITSLAYKLLQEQLAQSTNYSIQSSNVEKGIYFVRREQLTNTTEAQDCRKIEFEFDEATHKLIIAYLCSCNYAFGPCRHVLIVVKKQFGETLMKYLETLKIGFRNGY